MNRSNAFAKLNRPTKIKTLFFCFGDSIDNFSNAAPDVAGFVRLGDIVGAS
jgi:hypothetical protein